MRDDDGDVYTATTPLGCPHCKSPLAPNPPGVFYCGGCGKAYTVPSPDQLARASEKQAEDKRIFLLVGGMFFLVYVMPVLVSVGMALAMMLVYVAVAFGVIIASMG